MRVSKHGSTRVVGLLAICRAASHGRVAAHPFKTRASNNQPVGAPCESGVARPR